MFRYFRKHQGSIIAAFSRRKRKSSLSSRVHNGRHAQHCRLNIETLEHRWMLSNGPIVINELHVDPNIKTEPVEYIELYNAGASTMNLSGWYFSNGVGYTFSSGTQLAANQYLVVSENPAAVQTKYGVSSLGPFTGKLSNEGETVTLCDASGTVQDEVTYGLGFPWPTVGDDPGNSMELINPALDNNLGGSWRSSISVPVTRQTIIPLNSTWRYFKGTMEPSTTQGLWRQQTGFSDASWPQGQAAIGYGNDADEQGWIKTTLGDMNGGYSSLYLRKTFNVSNLSTLTSLLLEMRYDDGINVWVNGHYVANANVTAENLAYNATAISSIEADELVPFTINNPASYLVASGNVIAVQLLNCAKSDVDAFFDCQLTAIYGTKAGVTPGAKNSVYAANAPPQIRQVNNFPKQPVAGQNVVITAKVTDPDGVAGVQLKYQLVNPGDYIAINDDRYNDPAQWNTVTMYDDGTHGDATATDGVYTAVLAGTLQTNRLLVRYRISATDSLGASITTPYADDPQPNFAYYVYNGIPDWTAAVQPGVTTPVTYPSSLLDDLPALQLLTTKTAHDDSQHIPNSTTSAYTGSDYLWYGTLIYNGVVYDDISYRARGGVWRYAMGKNMWKFEFNRGHEFQPLDNYGQPYGVPWKKLNLSAIIQQGNYWHRGEQGLFESVGFELFNLAGVPAENTSFVGFRIVENASETGSNQYNTDFQGMYLMVEQPDGNLLDEHGLPDGNLYKMESGTGTSNNQGPTQVSDGSDLASFLNTYNNTTPTAQWWSDNLDLNEYYSYRAIVEGIHQYDIGDGKNYFYYHNPDTNKWEVLPWDLDLTWANNMYGSGNEPFLSRVLASSQTTFNQDYRNRMREIRDLLYNPEQTGMLIDEMASFIYTPGQLSWVDADCAMWDYNPIMTSSYVNSSKAGVGRYYAGGAGDLPTNNFAGMIQLMKNYVASRGAWIDSTILTDNAQIPNKPTATYAGQSGYPLDQLSFKASVYSSPVGLAAAAMEWRIAKVTDTSSPNYDPNAPRDYEITALWESGEMPVSTSTVAIPGNSLVIGATYRVRVRFKDAAGRWSHWSDPVQFVAAAPAVPLNNYLRITEIMYNPPAPTAAEIAAGYTDNNSFEYVEVTNTSSSNLQLSGVKFTKGVTFTFGNMTLQPGQRVLVVNNAAAFTFRYGTGYNIAGTYSGKFDNSGEEVKLESASGVVQDFTYDDNDPWPGRADGKGSSLEVKNTSGDYNDPDNWRSSSEYGGSPGRAGIGPIHGVVVNEVLSHTDYPLYDSIELYNTTNAAVNISGWYLSDSSDDYKKYRIPDGTVLAPY
ncbi:MAG: lamin tail domain-containing protein, partial [Thermoguttaceae bacterium]